VKDLAREHCRLDDPTYDGRRLADAALVPRERRPRWAHPVEAAQQVLVAPRVQVVICMRGKKVDQQRAVNGKKTELAQARRDGEASWRHMYAATTTRWTLVRCARVRTSRSRRPARGNHAHRRVQATPPCRAGKDATCSWRAVRAARARARTCRLASTRRRNGLALRGNMHV